MSSRWISTSLSWPRFAEASALTAACAALTSDDLPMPRAPHSSALLAGRPLAKRSVFSTSVSRTRSMPLSSDISTRLTRGTGASRAVRMPDEGVGGGEIGRRRRPRRQPLERVGDALEHVRVSPLAAALRLAALTLAADFDFDLAIGLLPDLALS